MATVNATDVIDGNKNQHEINTEQNNLNLTINNFVNPKMFGAIGDGIADDTQAIKDCFDHMIANSTKLYDYSGSVYKHVETIVVNGANKLIEIEGNVTFESINGAFSFSGSLTPLGNIASAPLPNDKQIIVSEVPSTLKQEDIVVIHNQLDFSFSEYRSYYKDGEIKRVANVEGSTIKLTDELETTYTGISTDKVFKLEPIKLRIIGNIKFKSDYQYGLKVTYCADSVFNEMEVLSLSGKVGTSYAFLLERSFNCRITGGKFIKKGDSTTGTDYGICFSNCQDIIAKPNYCFGYRHAVATGGGSLNGCVPCRRIYIEEAILEIGVDTGIHCADFHGNTIDSHYKQCTIRGMVGLGGRNNKSIENKITMHKDEVRPPIFVTECSGPVYSIGDYIVDCGAANAIMQWASSGTAVKNTRQYSFTLQDVRIGKGSLIWIMNIANYNSAPCSFILDGFEFVESIPHSSLTSLVNNAIQPGAKKPSLIQITNPKTNVNYITYISSDTNSTLADGTSKLVFDRNGIRTDSAPGHFSQQADGTMICRHRISGTVAINTAHAGGYKTTDLNWVFPRTFVEPPTIVAISLDNVCISAKAQTITASSANIFGFALSSFTSSTVNIDVIAIGRHLY
ncbi:hypothetical protein MKL42_09485 [Acinetobacter sp. AOR15_HL]|uniref:phage tailspike polysaccharide lyase family protein n=1 Tax=unclassified Acinetobacter TaxID=196816 RepID=UPI0022EAE576|nr:MULTISPECIES: hypothetical protein [unclassified Acinetobacter]MDA3557722.1 hypothetical protein [Acinetobacter sp. AOR15_HL]MDA3570935.1 hypothetical protein [Acinetobacter sp. AOR14_HL]